MSFVFYAIFPSQQNIFNQPILFQILSLLVFGGI